MIKKRCFFALLLSIFMFLQTGMSVMAEEAETIQSNEPQEGFKDVEEPDEDLEMQEYLEEAQEALAQITGQEYVMALVYLSDTYPVRKEPDHNGETVITVESGITVLIEGVGLDTDYNVWYQVSLENNGNTYTGYVERNNLAYSNEVFIEWENQYFPQIATFALERGGYADIEQFPESYQDKLMQLKLAHPNWIFVRQNTGLDWQSVVRNENYKDRNLISSKMDAAYRGEYYGQSWYYASKAAVEYYLDPRNFLDETRIFQFEQLTYNPSYHSKAAVQNILNNTFMKV